MTTPNVSDVGESNTGASSATPEDSSQTVSYASYKKLLDQKKSQDNILREQNARIAEIEAADAAKREDQLRAEKRYDEIIDALKARVVELEARIANDQREIANSMKQQALEHAIGGFAHPEYSRFAKLDSIGFTEDGNVDPDALSREATRIREMHPHLLKQTAAPLPSGAPASAVSGNTPSVSEREAYQAEVQRILNGSSI